MAKFWGQWIVFIGCVTLSWLLCYVSCVIVTVTRQKQDFLTNPVLSKTDCSQKFASACPENARLVVVDDLCVCECVYSHSTIFKTDVTFKCVKNLKMRNKNGTLSNPWTYLLTGTHSVRAPVAVLNLTFNTDEIEFKINVIPNDNTVRGCSPYDVEVANINGIWSQINHQFESRKINVSSKKYQDALASLTLMWKFNQSLVNHFDGKIMRIRIKCLQQSNRKKKSVLIDDFIIFKICGTVHVDIPEASNGSSTYLIPSLSASTPSRYPSTSKLMKSSSLINVHSVSTSSNQMMVTSLFSPMLTPSTRIISTIHSIFPTTTSTITKLPFSLTPSTVTYSSSVISSSPGKQSDDSSVTKAVAIAVVGGVVLVLVVVAFLFYILCRRKERKERKESENAGHGKIGKYIDKTIGSSPLTALSNPVFQEGTYENPEDIHDDKKRQSGANHINSALYDHCLVVENPGARNVSLYDNVTEPTKEEHAYQPLDPAKREPSAKYQSLIKPKSESSAPISGSSSPGCLMTTSDEQSKASGVVEPFYNVLEVDGAGATTTEDDHVYNILEQSNESEGKIEPVYSVLEGEENN